MYASDSLAADELDATLPRFDSRFAEVVRPGSHFPALLTRLQLIYRTETVNEGSRNAQSLKPQARFS